MKVLAAPGILVPKEHNPRDYISDTPPEGSGAYEVPDSAYYLRRIADGDLIDVEAAPVDVDATKKAKKE